MDDHGHVDAVRYPAFAELERTSTWFRNAYAVYDSTEHAQPSIMDGDYPAAGELPIASDHPASLFTLFGKTHRMNVSEEATALCPRGLCEDPRLAQPYGERMKSMASDLGLVWLHMVSPAGLEAKLPSVSDNWGNFSGGAGVPNTENVQANLTAARKARFDDWVRDITPGRAAAAEPQAHPPAARAVAVPARREAVQGRRRSDPGPVERVLQGRHAGRVALPAPPAPARLRRPRARRAPAPPQARRAVRQVADRGHRRPRRRLQLGRARPPDDHPRERRADRLDPAVRQGAGAAAGHGQRRAYVETVDIVPTIFDVLNVRPLVRMDGRSAFSPEVQRRRSVRILQRRTFKPLRFTRRRVGARQGRGGRAQAAPLRGRQGRAAAAVPHRAASGAALTAGAELPGRAVGRCALHRRGSPTPGWTCARRAFPHG